MRDSGGPLRPKAAERSPILIENKNKKNKKGILRVQFKAREKIKPFLEIPFELGLKW